MSVEEKSVDNHLIAKGCVLFLLGLVVGGWMFRDLRPRSIFAVDRCQEVSCLRLNEVTGLAAAVGIQRIADAFPLVVLQTDKTIVFTHPLPQAPYHYIIVPKKDIKSIEDLGAEDRAYLIDAYAVMNELIREKHLTTYQIKTNGPGYQDVAYLHFHLLAEK